MSDDAAYALVAPGRPVRGEFTYAVPPELRGKLQPGQRVKVSFGRGTALGFYLAPAPEPPPELRALPRLCCVWKKGTCRPSRILKGLIRILILTPRRCALPKGLSPCHRKGGLGSAA